jgi:hypothetical protein
MGADNCMDAAELVYFYAVVTFRALIMSINLSGFYFLN